MTRSEFATYLAAFWLLGGDAQIPTDPSMHESLARALKAHALDLERSFAVSFSIKPSPIHGTSQTVADMFQSIVMLGLGYYRCPSNGYLCLRIPKEQALAIVARIPAPGRQTIRRIADDALRNRLPQQSYG